MTGSSATQVGSNQVHRWFFGINDAIRAALLAMGYEVEQRVPNPEEDIKMAGHDLIVAGVACIATLGGRYSQDIYYMIDQWNKQQFPMICYASDWHMRSVHSTAEGIIREPERIREKSTALGRPHHDWAMEHLDGILGGAQAISGGKWPPFILHRFPWGSEDLMAKDVRATDVWSLDPSGYMPQWSFDPPDMRVDEWTCPRLQTLYDQWLNDLSARLEWPITRFGNQRLQEPTITEDKVPQVISESWGTLVPPGYHSGMGLWRSRYLMAAWTRTPLYADPAEGISDLDPSLNVKPWAIEAMTPYERADLAAVQAQVILSRVWSRQQFVDQLHRLMSHATGSDLGVAPGVPARDDKPPIPTVQATHPLLTIVQRQGPRKDRPTRIPNPCCAAFELLPDQVKYRGHHPECPDVRRPVRQPPRPCQCSTWVYEEGTGPVSGHHPTCPKVQRGAGRQSANPDVLHSSLRPKPGEEGYLEFDAHSGMYHRPGTLDYYVIKEMKTYDPMALTKEDVVLDVGGHIGGFATRAARLGAEVWSYEPDPENYAILCRNVEQFNGRVHTVQAALTSDGHTEGLLYKNLGANTGTHSMVRSRGREEVTVPVMDFSTVMAELRPTAIKIDVEAGEYALDYSNIPDSVRVFCMELHRTKRGLQEKSLELAKHIEDLGFDYIRRPNLEGGAWAVLAIWKRRTGDTTPVSSVTDDDLVTSGSK